MKETTFQLSVGPALLDYSLSVRNRLVVRLDKDGDGKVSRSEFEGHAKRFSNLDKNNNGYITKGEAPKGPPPSDSRHRSN
ncbi:MAG: hypothetical protein HKP41_07040 [Desulfobacterales bacterium]|nr:hypothetical protein [Deltaproteobacteria bacterium]NNK94091.1 hypothetical protein [Desulfobacterales bacterium]